MLYGVLPMLKNYNTNIFDQLNAYKNNGTEWLKFFPGAPFANMD